MDRALYKIPHHCKRYGGINVRHEEIILPPGFANPWTLASLPHNTPILVGFSGGADSSALLCILKDLVKENGARLCVAHVHHGIRGKEADRDSEFCRCIAKQYGAEFFLCTADVPRVAKETGDSVETAARKVRYAFFEKIMREQDIPLLVTAHNANDNLETMLFHMIRGSSLDGICGIPQVRPFFGGTDQTKSPHQEIPPDTSSSSSDHHVPALSGGGILVRPLLGVSRDTILGYCHARGLSYVTDSTNTDTDYTRNKIRSQIVSVMRQINPEVLAVSNRLCKHLRRDAEFLNTEAKVFLKNNRSQNRIPLPALQSASPALSSRVITLLWSEMPGNTALSARNIEDVTALVSKAVPHSSLHLPDGKCAIIEDGCFAFLSKQERKPEQAPEDYFICLHDGNNPISQTNCEIVIGNSQKTINIYKKAILLYFASDKIKGAIVARNRRPGDTIRMGGMHKSLKKLICEKKIPLAERVKLPVLCDSDGILAVPFVGIRDGAGQQSGLAIPGPGNAKDSDTEKKRICLQFYIY